MNHGMTGRKFNRPKNQRRALLMGLSKALITEERIVTTLPKAKDLRPIVERLVSVGRGGTLAARRRLLSFFRGDKNIQKKLIEVLGKRYETRPGGYTRILKMGYRTGDNAPMAMISFVDQEGEIQEKDRKNEKKKVKKVLSDKEIREKRVRGSSQKSA